MFRSFARALRPLSNAYTRGLPRPMPRLLSRTPMGLPAGNYKAPSIQTRPARNPATSFKTRLALPTPGSFGAFASGSGGSGRAGEDVPRWVLGSGLGLVAFFSGDDAHKKTDQILHERGLRQLLKKHGWARKIKLGSIVGLGVNLNEELHPETSSRVKDDPIRQKTTEKMKAAGSEVVWLEASGLLEMGAYVGATIPVGIFGDGTVGFDSKGLIEYRFMSPISAEAQNKGAREVHGGTLLLPTTREELLGIHPGSEFEIRGYGKMSGRALTSVGRRSFSSGIGPFYAASVGGNALWEGNLILKMKVLDHQGKVEMFVIRDENRTGRLEARLNAGFGLDPTSMPTLGKGYLGALARKKGSKSISRCLKRFGGADFKAYWQDTSQENGMGRYVLDIRTPDGLCAYTSLLGLEVDKAESLSVIQNSGVKSIGYHSTEENSEVGLEASLGASVLLLYRALEAERSGELSKNGKETTCFRENKFKKVSGNFMTGKRTVCWDSVTLSENAKSPTTFYNLKFTNEDKITTEKEIERFFNFAKTLGIKEAHKSRRELPKTMSDFSRAFANEDDTKVEVDIYFAKAGIDKIATTSNEEARKVILASRAQFDPTAKGLKDLSASQFRMALSSVEKYRDSEIKSSVDEVGGDWSMMQVEEEYRKRLGRSLVADMPHLEEAKNFMHHKEGLTAAATPEERRDFFVQLGGDKGFGFMPAISALATLAGEKDSVINTLRMRGGEVELEAVSEGRIAHSTLMGVREFEAVEVF